MSIRVVQWNHLVRTQFRVDHLRRQSFFSFFHLPPSQPPFLLHQLHFQHPPIIFTISPQHHVHHTSQTLSPNCSTFSVPLIFSFLIPSILVSSLFQTLQLFFCHKSSLTLVSICSHQPPPFPSPLLYAVHFSGWLILGFKLIHLYYLCYRSTRLALMYTHVSCPASADLWGD